MTTAKMEEGYRLVREARAEKVVEDALEAQATGLPVTEMTYEQLQAIGKAPVGTVPCDLHLAALIEGLSRHPMGFALLCNIAYHYRTEDGKYHYYGE